VSAEWAKKATFCRSAIFNNLILKQLKGIQIKYSTTRLYGTSGNKKTDFHSPIFIKALVHYNTFIRDPAYVEQISIVPMSSL